MHALDHPQQRCHPWWLRSLLGLAFVALAAAALFLTFATPATAETHDGHHEAMHRMMDGMHGEGMTAEMHQLDGTEQMMEECSNSMGAMGSMMGSRGSMMGARSPR